MSERTRTTWCPRRIAIFRALYLGDLLLAVPALRAIRAGFPEAEITLIGLPWAASFARRFRRYIDRFVEFIGYPGIQEVPVFPEQTKRFLDEQRAYNYDLVVQMHGSGRTSNAFALALGGRVTVGYYCGESPGGLTLGAPYPQDQPEVCRNLGLVGLLGCSNVDPRLEFPLFAQDRAEAAALLQRLPQPGRPLIGLHPGASYPARRWPAEYFAALADDLAQHLGCNSILTGGPGEKSTVRAVVERMETQPLNLAGETSIGGLAALISQVDLFISNDTGPAHLADALNTPSVTIFGPADPRRWAPLERTQHPIVWRNVACSPCTYRECPIDHRCLRWIRPETVSAMARKLLARKTMVCNV
jgi:ADP-heptose:LPS heptosyltransferase